MHISRAVAAARASCPALAETSTIHGDVCGYEEQDPARAAGDASRVPRRPAAALRPRPWSSVGSPAAAARAATQARRSASTVKALKSPASTLPGGDADEVAVDVRIAALAGGGAVLDHHHQCDQQCEALTLKVEERAGLEVEVRGGL